jgi:hypothetical protein
MVGADFGPTMKVLNENNVCKTNVINTTTGFTCEKTSQENVW